MMTKWKSKVISCSFSRTVFNVFRELESLVHFRKSDFVISGIMFNQLYTTSLTRQLIRGSFKKYVDFYHNFFSRRHITLRFGTHIWTTNSVDLKEKFLNLT